MGYCYIFDYLSIIVSSFLDTDISFVKGVGPTKSLLLKEELGWKCYRDALYYLPYRYEDRSIIHKIDTIQHLDEYVQLVGSFHQFQTIGTGRTQRLNAVFKDDSGFVEITWFKGIKWITEHIKPTFKYLIYGKVQKFNNKLQIIHPEVELLNTEKSIQDKAGLVPLYSTTEKLRKRGLESRQIHKIIQQIVEGFRPSHIKENLPDYILQKIKLPNRYQALSQIHHPESIQQAQWAKNRMKFEELFYYQLKIYHKKNERKTYVGFKCEKVGKYFNEYYQSYIPFDLTGAQKRVVREIRKDMGSGIQMNRLLQGDVGSGKTMVAIMSMLLAADNGLQSAMMAPTEILAQQHYESVSEQLQKIGLKVALLTGSIKGKQRSKILDALRDGYINVLVGTHALIEDWVQFYKLGLIIIDEQHRFGVAQRAKLRDKNEKILPHVLVMSATPIPRTLAMTEYGDLDISIIDELPPGRKPIETIHKFESSRLWTFAFIKKQIALGRQIYIVYPLIAESETLDLNNLAQGYIALQRDFPEPQYHISIVHGKLKSEDKESEMKRFVEGKTHIMIATTVIEVGVNVPNASVMIIENAERFGLAQLHQLRGRVGRGADQSYCILMSDYKLSENGKKRIETMCATNDGFVIAEVDMQLRGAGDMDGTQQSGAPSLHFSDLVTDMPILSLARDIIEEIYSKDPTLELEENSIIKFWLEYSLAKIINWREIS